MEKLAPICLFAYRRKDHLRDCINSLLENPEARHSKLYVFSDAAKTKEDEEKVASVREYLETVDGFFEVEIFKRSSNWGLSRSIIDGVTHVIAEHESVIVVEDDLVLSPCFLSYMNNALKKYVLEERVASIHGYVYPVEDELPDTFFLRGADCWGWATWSRAWKNFRHDGVALKEELLDRNLKFDFDLEGSTSNFSMLESFIEGKNDSWAIRWHASCFLENKLTLYPGNSLVCNRGVDGSGQHGEVDKGLLDAGYVLKYNLADIPIVESDQGKGAFVRYSNNRKPSLLNRVKRKVKVLLNL